MAPFWYIAKEGTKVGPFTFDQLCQKVASGFLTSDDMVWNEGVSIWVAANTVPGLLVCHEHNHPNITQQEPLGSEKKLTTPNVHLVQGGVGLLVGVILIFTPLFEWGIITIPLSVIFLLYGIAKYNK